MTLMGKVSVEAAKVLNNPLCDPFAPFWDEAPEWAQWHTVHPDDGGEWWESCPYVVAWWDMDDKGDDFDRETWMQSETGSDRHEQNNGWQADIDGERTKSMDWRNSLRHRPIAIAAAEGADHE